MSLFTSSLLPGILLLLVGLPLALDVSGVKVAIKAFPRSISLGYVVFSVAAAWFLYDVLHLSNADFGEYKYLLFIGFALVAILSFKSVPDFLGVRGVCALVLIGASPFLDSAFMQYDHPARLFMVSLVYVALAISIFLGAQPWRLRDFFNWLFARSGRSRLLGGIFVAYGVVLCCAAFALR
ncbi:MAG TPA: hypothetical protein VFE25_01335 [Opitutaceae bacterium]|jgi:hypothetical protein|nr:hypothetical protein [Opitutaceae bacterium]